MLNKKGERELAYIVKVDNVEPIEGYDRIAFATVGGWHCVVDATMKAGDRAVYFEIDSLVPAEDERFAFCQKYKYRIRTQRYCRGTRISQGLLLPLDLFPELKGYEVGDFVTDKLKVTYYEVEDRQRKGKERSTQEYKPFFNKIKKHFPCKQLLRTTFGKKILFSLFGIKKKKKNWPEFMPKTDEERCLVANTYIQTNKGKIRIADIVNKNLDVEILTYDEKGDLSYQPIVNRQVINCYEDLIKIWSSIFEYGNRLTSIVCTLDHKILTREKGWIESKYVSIGDHVLTHSSHYPDEIIPYAYACILGDGHMYMENRIQRGGTQNNKVRIDLTQGIKQLGYLKWKQQLFNIKKIYNMGKTSFGGDDVYRASGIFDELISQYLINDGCVQNRKFRITEEFCARLTKESIAIWYQDDGSLSYNTTGNHTPFIRIASNRYDEKSNILLCNRINELFKINAKVYAEKNRGFYDISITGQDVYVFLNQIKHYIHKDCKYKLVKEMQDAEFFLNDLHFEQKERPIWTIVTKIELKPYKYTKHGCKKLFDLTIKENHNFFANNILTHNCQNMTWVLKNKTPFIVSEKVDGCSSGFGIQKKPLGGYQYYVCSRNVVLDSPNSKAYYDFNVWYEMYEKYHIKDFLTDYIKKTGATWVYLQGESFGTGIQKRDYSLDDHDFRAFALNDSTRKCRCSYVEMADILDRYDIPTVPILDKEYILPDSVDELLKYAASESKIDGKPREGIVLQSVENPSFSFKAVDPEFLMTYHS